MEFTTRFKTEYVPMELWGEDHWSTLAYAETVMVECAGDFQVGYDPMMRQGRRHSRVMLEQCARPKRPGRGALGVVMTRENSTRLSNGLQAENHDDWHCIRDMAVAGLFKIYDRETRAEVEPDDTEPGNYMRLTPLGVALVQQVRSHKMAGGTWATFKPTPVEAAAA